MNYVMWLVAIVLLMGGCASKEAAWQRDGALWIRDYKRAVLTGDKALAAFAWQKAESIARTSADPAVLGRLEVIRYGITTALGCPVEIERDVQGVEEGYQAFLSGDLHKALALGLPKEYEAIARAALAGEIERVATLLTKMESSHSVLVAAAVLKKRGIESEAIYREVIARASHEGYTAALACWLANAKDWYERLGRSAEAAQMEQRIKILEGAKK